MTKPAWSTRTARDRQDTATHTALLDAAEALFAEQGYKQTPIARIAERAGVSRPTFYVYFSSRDDVMRALAERVRDEIADVQRAAGRSPGGPHAVIAHSIRAAVEVYARKTRLLTVVAHQALVDPGVERLWDEIMGAPTDVDAAFIRRLQLTHGVDPAAPADAIAEVVTAALLRVAAIAAREPDRRDALADDLIAMYHRLVGLPASVVHREMSPGT